MTQASIDIAARPEQVMDVITDFEAYPEWVDGMTETEIVKRFPDGQAEHVRIVLRTTLINDDYVIKMEYAPNRVSWKLVQGHVLKVDDGTYELTDKQDLTRVVYKLKVDLNVPVLGMLKRRAEKAIIDSALKGLKKRVEG